MTAERWRQLEDIFQEALDAAPAARTRVLDRACAGDAALREEVECLLREAEDSGDFLETPAMDITLSEAAAAPPDPMLGQTAGPYRIESELGRGGMGVVYLAMRDDGTYRQQVALKVVRGGFETPELLDRFRRERQILAMVNHPNIARILDGGTTAAGRPFYALEFVEGEPLTKHCFDRKLGLAARLRLFLDTCAAVAHAHQNLIIHRDLKPANILVTPEGAVKLLDFGIAKIFLEELPDAGLTIAAGAAALTPNYAAPEQVRGERVTTATDIYALGLVLYETLTGLRAQEAENPSPRELERAVCETNPRRPFEAANENGVPRANLRGDLERIVMKALRKDPARRYATVNQFAEDLERYLAGRPVIARPDSVWYRASMFVRRNKLGVAAAVLVAASLVGGIAVAAWQARVARGHFESVRSLAKSLFTEINPAILEVPGTTKARHLIVTRSVEYLDKLSAAAGNDPAILLEAAEAYEAVADIQGNRNKSNLGDYAGALASFRKALVLRDRVQRIAPTNSNLHWIGLINATAARIYPNSEESLAMARKAVTIGERIRDDGGKALQLAYPNALFGLGYVLTMREDPEAVAAFEKAREVYVKIGRPNSAAVCDRYLGNLMRDLGRPEDALAHYRRALAFDEPRVAKRPAPRERMDLSYDYEFLGMALGDVGRWREGLASAEKARAIRADLAKADPNDNRARLALVDSNESLSFLLAGAGMRAEALVSAETAVKGREAIARAAPDSPEDKYELARTYFTVGLANRLLGRCEAAAEWFEKARPALESQNRKFTLRRLEAAKTCAPR